ncbi:MAG: phosphatidate cytidylyltransferase, partial [Alphaproteobacteria bacterium]|nr:phosphatidate cytidylyltransferase [Alphaproteobacteria bacterium]
MKKDLLQNSSNLQLRIISALFIGLVFITAIFFIRPLFFILILIIAAIMLVEWYEMTYSNRSYLYSGL